MNVSWESSDSALLANPTYSPKELARFQLILEKATHFKSHIWLSTSGTSNQKWVGLSKNAILSSANAVNEHLKSTKSDCWINTLPEFHIGGLAIWARAYLSGSSVFDFRSFVGGKWEAEKFYQVVIDQRGTLSALVPTQLYDLIALGLKAPKTLRAVIVGGGALLPELYEQGIALGWPILPTYGSTECASQIATATLSSLIQNQQPALTLLSHIKARIQEKSLSFSGACLLSVYAYLQNDDIQFFDPKVDGWFESEDRGVIANGEVKIEGRRDSIVKILGENVDLARLEMILQKLRLQLKVKSEVTLSALPDLRIGKCLHLVSNSCDEQFLHSLVEDFNRAVLPFERIKKICLVENIPRTMLGKINQQELIQKVLKNCTKHAQDELDL